MVHWYTEFGTRILCKTNHKRCTDRRRNILAHICGRYTSCLLRCPARKRPHSAPTNDSCTKKIIVGSMCVEHVEYMYFLLSCCLPAVTRVRSQGTVTVSFNIVTKDMRALGYDASRPENGLPVASRQTSTLDQSHWYNTSTLIHIFRTKDLSRIMVSLKIDCLGQPPKKLKHLGQPKKKTGNMGK